MRHHLFQPELFYILENPYEEKKKRTKSPKYKDTLKKKNFFPMKHKKAGVFEVQYCNILTILNL